MRIAIIGLGSIGMRHATILHAWGYHLMGYDVRPIPGDFRLPILASENDLWDWGPKKVLVCTPPDTHASWACRALAAGCDVFVEKPLALTVKDAERICEEAAIHKKQVAVGYMLRAVRPLYELKERADLFTQAKLWCRWQMMFKTYPQDAIAESSHELDLALWLFGPATVKHRNVWKSGATIGLQHAGGQYSQIEIEAKADIYERGIALRDTDANYTERLTYTPATIEPSYRTELHHFLDGFPLCTGREGLETVKLMEVLRA